MSTREAGQPEHRPVRAGRVLGGRYTLVSRIAKGGMGEVWKVRDRRTGALVAAKVLRPELTGEEISLSRLRLEAQNTVRARHPNIAAVLDSGEDDGQGWIVMELVEGRPLTEYVGEGRRLSAPELIPILTQTAYALDGAAKAGIVHRDIKPANIIVRADGMVKLTDFGISYAQGQANLTAVGMVMGTAQYLAPEQAMGGEATTAGDLYSLGVIAYEALAGKRPFTGKSAVEIAMAHVKEDIPELPADVPGPVIDIVFGLLSKNPSDRPQSGTALVRALTRAASELEMSTAPTPLAEPAAPLTSETPVDGMPASIPPPIEKPSVPVAEKDDQNAKPEIPTATRRADARLASVLHGAPVAQADQAGSTVASQNARWHQLRADSSGGETIPSSATSLGEDLNKVATPPPPPVRRQDRGSGPADSRIADPARSAETQSWAILASAQSASPSGTVRWRPVTNGTSTDSEPDQRSRADTPGPGISKDKIGAWVIVALVVLTIVLILVAALRDRAQAAPLSAGPELGTVTHMEVEAWLIPTHSF